MATWTCPQCKTTFPEANLPPGEPPRCPNCARTAGPWADALPGSAASAWSNEPPTAGNPWSDRADNSKVDLPFDAALRRGPDRTGADSVRRVIYGLAGLAVFLALLTGVVLLARQLRPLVGRSRAGIGSAKFEQWVRELGRKETQQPAARALVAEGTEAVSAALDRITEMSDGEGESFNIYAGAVRAFADAGPEAAAPLATALASPKTNVRLAAGNILREMGPSAAGAREALIVALADKNRRVRWFAIEALGNLGAEGKDAAESLVPLITDADVVTRRTAIDALGRIGPDAQVAVPALTKARGQDVALRRSVEASLRQINVAEAAAQGAQRADGEVRESIKRLQGDDETVGRAAAKSLGELGPKAAGAIPALALALRSNEPWRREAAAQALGGLGLLANDYVPTLRVASKDRVPEVRRAAEKALAEIEGRK